MKSILLPSLLEQAFKRLHQLYITTPQEHIDGDYLEKSISSFITHIELEVYLIHH